MGTERRVFKHTIPVDDRDHTVPMGWTAEPLAVVVGAANEVLFWFEDHGGVSVGKTFRIFGTGHPVPRGYLHRGTAMHGPSGLVWHLFERPSDSGEDRQP